MNTQQTILVVDDEATIREVVRRYLEREGFRVIEAQHGYDALATIETQRPDLIVLDIMLPGIDGFSIARSLRNSDEYAPLRINGDIPIVMLTARKDELDRLTGFELGADDYVMKPFSPRELVARIKAVLRRSGAVASNTSGSAENPIVFADLSIDPRTRLVSVQDKPITLTAKEFELLWFLVRYPRQVFSRTQLLDQVWGYEFYGDESTVTVHVRRLREKIEPDPSQPTYIQTVWGVGYKFDPAS